jgi:hypothetical protein
MKATHIPEPELEFGAGRHVDVRFGIANYGPFDRDKRAANPTIRLGVVGTHQTIEGVLQWLDKCRTGIPGKESKRPNLFPEFPGFGEESCFGCAFACEPRSQRGIPQREFDALTSIKDQPELVEKAASLFISEIEYLANETNVEAIVCAPPLSMFELVDAADTRPAANADVDDEDDGESAKEVKRGVYVFHHLLKARVMRLNRPIQLVRPQTYGGKASKAKHDEGRVLQDEATRAWNFHTALYYKAGGIPWRMIRDPAGYTTCFVGISFYKTLDEKSVMTSLAQVFNERGDGVVVRGGPARVSKEDRTLHLPPEAAAKIVVDALRSYRSEHKAYPARVVIHKSSEFDLDERDAIIRAVSGENIEMCDLLSMRRTHTRLFRVGYYPPLRGTCLELDVSSHILYTRGSVHFFEDYPGMYIPRPLDIRYERIEQSAQFLAREVLALTKMNWNNTQFDGGEPITLRASRQVASVIKYVPLSDSIHPRYSYYM